MGLTMPDESERAMRAAPWSWSEKAVWAELDATRAKLAEAEARLARFGERAYSQGYSDGAHHMSEPGECLTLDFGMIAVKGKAAVARALGNPESVLAAQPYESEAELARLLAEARKDRDANGDTSALYEARVVDLTAALAALQAECARLREVLAGSVKHDAGCVTDPPCGGCAHCRAVAALAATPGSTDALREFVRLAARMGSTMGSVSTHSALPHSPDEHAERVADAILGEPEVEPVPWRCQSCGKDVPDGTTSHGRADHAPGCDGSCKNCPVEARCGPCGPILGEPAKGGGR